MHERWWLLGAAALFVLSIFRPWWVVSSGGTDFFEAGAYTSASRSLGNVLDGPTILVGILTTMGLFAGLVGFAVTHYMRRVDVGRAAAFIGAACALVGVLSAPLTWPPQWAKDVESRATPVEGEEPQGIDASWWGRDGSLRFRADWGWYAALAAIVSLVPAALGWPPDRRVPSLPKAKS